MFIIAYWLMTIPVALALGMLTCEVVIVCFHDDPMNRTREVNYQLIRAGWNVEKGSLW